MVFIASNGSSLYNIKSKSNRLNSGFGSNTSKLNDHCELPPSLTAVIVNNSEVELTDGVP